MNERGSLLLANLDRLFRKMRSRSLDAVICATPANVTYPSGFRSQTQWTFGAHIFVVVPMEFDIGPTIILPMGDLADFRELSSSLLRDVRCYGTFFVEDSREENASLYAGSEPNSDQQPIDVLLRILLEKNLECGNLGVDEEGFHGFEFETLRKRLSNAHVECASQLLRETRAVKTKEEIRRLTDSSLVTEKAIIEILL